MAKKFFYLLIRIVIVFLTVSLCLRIIKAILQNTKHKKQLGLIITKIVEEYKHTVREVKKRNYIDL